MVNPTETRMLYITGPYPGEAELLDIFSGGRSKAVLSGVQRQTPHALLVVRQRRHGFALSEIPQPHCLIMGSSDDL